MSQSPDDLVRGSDRLIAAQVTEFLRRNPAYLANFLERNPQMLVRIAPPPRDRGDGVVDLHSFMVSRLRAEVTRVTQRLDDVVATSRANLSAQALIHEAVLSLLEANSLEELIDVVTNDLAMMLSVDIVTLCVETVENPLPAARTPGVFLLENGMVNTLIGKNCDARLEAGVTGHPDIFGHAAGLVRSQALLRVHVSREAPPGLLALGVREEHHFDPSQGTELLTFLARTLGSTIRSWMHLPA